MVIVIDMQHHWLYVNEGIALKFTCPSSQRLRLKKQLILILVCHSEPIMLLI